MCRPRLKTVGSSVSVLATRIVLSGLAVLVAGALVACAGAAPASGAPASRPEKVTSSTPDVQEIIGFRISSSKPPLAADDPGTRLNYAIGDDGLYRGTVEVENGRPAAHEYLVTMYVDYVQTSFRVDGAEYRTLSVHMEPNQVRAIPFEIGPMPAGNHDLAAAVFADPQRHDLSEKYRLETLAFHFTSRRVNVQVGATGSWPKRADSAPAASEPIERSDGSVRQDAAFDGPVVNRSPDVYALWTTGTVEAGAPLGYFIHVGNQSNSPRRYALISLLDYEQVRGSGGKPVVRYVTVPPGEVLTLPASATPTRPGVHELIVLAGINPFSTLTDATFGDSVLERTARVGLVAR